MRLPGIDWLDWKNEVNQKEHEGLSFDDAQYVFFDPLRVERYDRSENNNSTEERWQTLGKVGKVLLVVYTERGDNHWIISARVADKDERRAYNGDYAKKGGGWFRAA